MTPPYFPAAFTQCEHTLTVESRIRSSRSSVQCFPRSCCDEFGFAACRGWSLVLLARCVVWRCWYSEAPSVTIVSTPRRACKGR